MTVSRKQSLAVSILLANIIGGDCIFYVVPDDVFPLWNNMGCIIADEKIPDHIQFFSLSFPLSLGICHDYVLFLCFLTESASFGSPVKSAPAFPMKSSGTLHHVYLQ